MTNPHDTIVSNFIHATMKLRLATPVTSHYWDNPNKPNDVPFDADDFHNCYTRREMNPLLWFYGTTILFPDEPYRYRGCWDIEDFPDTLDENPIRQLIRFSHLCEPNRHVYTSDSTLDEWQNDEHSTCIDILDHYAYAAEFAAEDNQLPPLILWMHPSLHPTEAFSVVTLDTWPTTHKLTKMLLEPPVDDAMPFLVRAFSMNEPFDWVKQLHSYFDWVIQHDETYNPLIRPTN